MTTISLAPALSRVKTDQFTFAYLQRYKIRSNHGENKNTKSCSQIDYGTTQTRLDPGRMAVPHTVAALAVVAAAAAAGKTDSYSRTHLPDPADCLPVALVKDAPHRDTCREARVCRIVSASVLKQYKRTAGLT